MKPLHIAYAPYPVNLAAELQAVARCFATEARGALEAQRVIE